MPESLSTEDLLALLEANRALAQEVNLRELVVSVLETANRLTDSTGSSVILYSREKRKLYFAHATGPEAETLLTRWGLDSEHEIPLEHSYAGRVFRTGETLVDQPAREDPDHFKGVDRDTRHTTTTIATAPLDAAGERVGVVQLVNKRSGRYDRRDLLVLEHIAAQAAIAIRNAQLFDRLIAHMGLYGALGRHAGPVELLEAMSAPARNEVMSVLFADMRGFTQMCHLIPRPERTQEMLDQFLSLLARAVLARDGIVNKFLGDGLLALFRGPEHAERAVACAGDMLAGFHALRDRWNAENNTSLRFLDLGIGITSDSVVIGSVGTEQVRDYTVVGTAVNLAANLVDHARGGRQILVDKMTFRAARHLIADYEGPEAFELRKPGQTVGHPYERYLLKALHPAGGAAAATPPAPARQTPATRNDVFISYSHRDAPWLTRLQVHLKPYVRGGAVKVWDDTMLRPGEQWRDEIARGLASARVAVLLVSPDFLDSEFIATNELPPLLDAAARRGLTIFWVPISASSFDETPIGAYQAALEPARPLNTLSTADQDEALVRLCKQLKRALNDPIG